MKLVSNVFNKIVDIDFKTKGSMCLLQDFGRRAFLYPLLDLIPIDEIKIQDRNQILCSKSGPCHLVIGLTLTWTYMSLMWKFNFGPSLPILTYAGTLTYGVPYV